MSLAMGITPAWWKKPNPTIARMLKAYQSVNRGFQLPAFHLKILCYSS